MRRCARNASGLDGVNCMRPTATCCTSSCRQSPTNVRMPTVAASRTACASRSRFSRPCARAYPAKPALWVPHLRDRLGGRRLGSGKQHRVLESAQDAWLRRDPRLQRRGLVEAADQTRTQLPGGLRTCDQGRHRHDHHRRRTDHGAGTGGGDHRKRRGGRRVSRARMLYDPRWPWHAAAKLGASLPAPKQYWRSHPREHANLFKDAKVGQR